MTPQISIIIVNWNVRAELERNLTRVFALRDAATREVIVVDNASRDGSGAAVAAQWPQVRLLLNAWNAGFAHAVNQGLRVASAPVVLLLNPDMELCDGALDEIVLRLNGDARLGVLGGRLETPCGDLVRSVRRDPSWRDQLAILLKVPHIAPRVTARYLCEDFDYAREQSVEQVRGSLLAFRRDVVDVVGPFDDGFYLWFEEVDFCRRVREVGYDVRYVPSVRATDLVGRSFAQVPTRTKQRLFAQSQRRYLRKWHPRWQWALACAATPLAIGAGASFDMARALKARRAERARAAEPQGV